MITNTPVKSECRPLLQSLTNNALSHFSGKSKKKARVAVDFL